MISLFTRRVAMQNRTTTRLGIGLVTQWLPLRFIKAVAYSIGRSTKSGHIAAMPNLLGTQGVESRRAGEMSILPGNCSSNYAAPRISYESVCARS